MRQDTVRTSRATHAERLCRVGCLEAPASCEISENLRVRVALVEAWRNQCCRFTSMLHDLFFCALFFFFSVSTSFSFVSL